VLERCSIHKLRRTSPTQANDRHFVPTPALSPVHAPGPAELMQDLHRSRGRGDDPTGTRVHRRPHATGTSTVPDKNHQPEQARPVSGHAGHRLQSRLSTSACPGRASSRIRIQDVPESSSYAGHQLPPAWRWVTVASESNRSSRGRSTRRVSSTIASTRRDRRRRRPTAPAASAGAGGVADEVGDGLVAGEDQRGEQAATQVVLSGVVPSAGAVSRAVSRSARPAWRRWSIWSARRSRTATRWYA